MAKKKVAITKKKIDNKTKSKTRRILLTLLGYGIKGMGFLVTSVVFFLFAIYIGIFGPLPSLDDLARINNDLASEVYANDGSLMGKYYYQNRMSVDNRAISKHVINALVATEDSRFFEHYGYDPVSIARVLLRTVLMGDSRQGGGSTINQQLAKNLYPRKSFGLLSLPVNKAKEIFIAARLEQVYSKNEILTLYLNTVPFGESVYGIEAASQRFFDKSSATLEPEEAAVLIGMLAANTAYNPRLHPSISKKRRNVVLNRMVAQDFISEAEAQKLILSDIKLSYHKFDHNNGIAPYFREIIKRNVIKILKDKYGDHYDLYSDGLKIYTSIDPTMQRYAQEAVQQHMQVLQMEFKAHWRNRSPWENSPEVFIRELHKSEKYKALKAIGKTEEEIKGEMGMLEEMTVFSYPKERQVHLSSLDSISHYLKILNTGFMVMDPQTGEVLSWVGGVSHKYFPYDHITARRQVGSTFKPIVYAAALENGMSPCDYFSNERRIYEDFDNWSPGNADNNYDGYYSMKGGLTNSVNTVTAEIMVQTGVDKVLNLAETMGISSKLPAVPSISLGTGEITLQEMLTAYSCFANDGKKTEVLGLLRIEDRAGHVLYEHKAQQETRVFDEKTAQLMNYMLQGVVNNGTGRSLRSVYGLRGQIAGKTGTTQNNADGWFIGYTPRLLAGAWVGADSPKVHFRTTALGQGAHMALPIYGLFMQKLDADPKYRKYTRSNFKEMPTAELEKLSCVDFSMSNPDKGFFDFLKSKNEKKRIVQNPSDTLDSKKVKKENSRNNSKNFSLKGLFKRQK